MSHGQELLWLTVSCENCILNYLQQQQKQSKENHKAQLDNIITFSIVAVFSSSSKKRMKNFSECFEARQQKPIKQKKRQRDNQEMTKKVATEIP